MEVVVVVVVVVAVVVVVELRAARGTGARVVGFVEAGRDFVLGFFFLLVVRFEEVGVDAVTLVTLVDETAIKIGVAGGTSGCNRGQSQERCRTPLSKLNVR